MEAYKTLEYRGSTIEIKNDYDSESPDVWGNDDVFLVYDHNQFYVKRNGLDPKRINQHTYKTKRMFCDGYHVFPLYAYIHSGVSLSLSESRGFDTSMKGYVLVKRQKGWSYTRTKAAVIAESLVEEWNMYLSGQVYDLIIDDEHECGGYYGDEGIKQAIEEAKNTIDRRYKKIINKHVKRLKNWIKSKVGFQYRKALILS